MDSIVTAVAIIVGAWVFMGLIGFALWVWFVKKMF